MATHELKAPSSVASERHEAVLAPAVILIDPQLGENIGAAARAMLNCGLTDLRLVRPRDGWPSDAARANAAGADLVIDGVQVFNETPEAIADLRLVYATTARSRDMTKPVLTPDSASEKLFECGRAGQRSGILFGCERSGLSNDDVTLANAVITFPLNPKFKSLNLGQAVLLVAWEWQRQQAQEIAVGGDSEHVVLAERGDVIRLFEHFETELDQSGFFFPPEKRPHMVRNLRNLLGRAALTENDVRTLHGVIRSLVRPR